VHHMIFRPVYILLLSLVLQTAAVYAGDWLRHRKPDTEETAAKDMSTLLPAALTLLALIIGFSFSMASGRYDQRKALEEEEANAIGTEYVRADLAPGHTAQIQTLLKAYLQQRILFYEVTDPVLLQQVDAATAVLQAQLWAAVTTPAIATPTPIMGVLVTGMNDVLNSQGYTQAMWWNRLPSNAWTLLLVVATFGNFLFGYSEYRTGRVRLIILPIIIALPFFLIADLDTPRRGLIHVVPQNLEALQASLQ
jgi:hypothetical protein